MEPRGLPPTGGRGVLLHRLEFPLLYVQLRVADHEDVAVHVAGSHQVPLELQLDPVFRVHELQAASVHRLACHGAEIDQHPELVLDVERFVDHVGG